MDNSFTKFIVLVIIVNILAYLTKLVLKKKGYPVSWFSQHLRDIPNLWRLIGKTKNVGEQFLYLILGTSYPILTAVFIVSALIHITSLAEIDWCEHEKQFRRTEWCGTVTKKFIDKANHAAETIEISNNGQVQIIQNWVIFQNGNFEQIEVGDSIVKKQGFVNLKLLKLEKEIELVVDYRCDEIENNNR